MTIAKKNKYRSGFEKKVAEGLTKRKIKFGFEDTKIKYVVPEKVHTYTPDFTLPNGVRVETKGKLDAAARYKMQLVKAQFPDEDIRILFMRDQPIRKGSSTYYSDWATKYGYDFAFGTKVPEEWLK